LTSTAVTAREDKSTSSMRPTFAESRRSCRLPFAFRGAACLAA
jgi:hypothetical protein